MADDYTNAPLTWKFRKTLRYTRLFGPGATLAKVRSQYHMNADPTADDRTSFINSRCHAPRSSDRSVAIVGCGKFSYSVIALYLRGEHRDFLRATLDTNLSRAISLCRTYDGAYATTEFDSILADEQVKLVFVASNHASHAEYAVRCIEAGKAVHIEKPHAVSTDQIDRLTQAMRRNPDVPVYLGFNRPRSPHFQKIVRAVARDEGPTTVNWFIAGHEIDPEHWYFAPEEGGRVLGNLCHWLDASIHLIGMDAFFPCVLIPGTDPASKNDFSLSIQCADGSVVVICFSAKGHTFEGVREILNLQRGSTLALLRDFEETRIDAGPRKWRHRSLWRAHGHGENIRNSYAAVAASPSPGEDPNYVVATGLLGVAARAALESGHALRLDVPEMGIQIDNWAAVDAMAPVPRE